MKVLLDTNIWIAAFLTHGVCHELLEHCLEHHEILISEDIYKEIEEKLRDKFKFPAVRIRESLSFIKEQAHCVPVEPLKEPVCRDPDDDLVLASLVSGRADCLITGDDDLLVLKAFKGIPILSPKKYWEFEKKFREEE
ncbi:MAG: putative toxin-antitoxin system toxin component, PIN family [Deltaproteobacteria bacterium]|nr:putative toxin-antitoxin system toxin component, PIN family [Deltaproteobacteria bacterium]